MYYKYNFVVNDYKIIFIYLFNIIYSKYHSIVINSKENKI